MIILGSSVSVSRAALCIFWKTLSWTLFEALSKKNHFCQFRSVRRAALRSGWKNDGNGNLTSFSQCVIMDVGGLYKKLYTQLLWNTVALWLSCAGIRQSMHNQKEVSPFYTWARPHLNEGMYSGLKTSSFKSDAASRKRVFAGFLTVGGIWKSCGMAVFGCNPDRRF